MPPPTPYSAVPVCASSMTVRIGTPNRAAGSPDPGGDRNPTAPQYTPRGESSRSAMISIVRTLGAPVTEPHGNNAANTSARPDIGSERRRDARRELPHGFVSLQVEHVAPRDRARSRHPAQVVAQQVDDHGVLRAVLHRTAEALGHLEVLGGPAPTRRGAFHRTGRQRVAVDPEEQFRRRRQHPVAAQVEVAGVGAPLRVAQVPIQAAFVALHLGSEPQGVVHLIGVARCDVFVDRADGAVVGLAIDRRPPGARRHGFGVGLGLGERGLLAALEHREPRQGQLLERVCGCSCSHGEGRIEARRRFVGDESRHPQTSWRPRPRRRRGCRGPRRVAWLRVPPRAPPAGTTVPRRSGRRIGRRARQERYVAGSLVGCRRRVRCWWRCRAGSTRRSPHACSPTRATR